MIDALAAQMAADAGLTPEQTARVAEAAATVVAQLGPFDMLMIAGKLMSAKSLIEGGDAENGAAILRELAEHYGLGDLLDELGAELRADAPLPLDPGD